MIVVTTTVVTIISISFIGTNSTKTKSLVIIINFIVRIALKELVAVAEVAIRMDY